MKGMGRFQIRNFGCRATQADGAALAGQLVRLGYQEADSTSDAELVVLNTCTVTSHADEDARQAVRRVHRENPSARILVTGCYAQRSPEELAALPGVRWVVGNSHKVAIPDIVREARAEIEFHGEIRVGDISAHREFLSAPVHDAGDRTRPNLKIQDGCNNPCTFCVIPSVRGPSRSAPADDVVAQVQALSSRYREVVLSGINLGRWGRDPGKSEGVRLAGLLHRLIVETDIERIRLSSVEPMDWSDELLEVMAESTRVAPHVHIPLQSGCDSVLKRMKRRYRARHYADRVEKARSLMPDAAIGADVMTGFPGETDSEFEENRAFVAAMPFTYLHVFTYSERPGTPAAASADQVPVPIRKERNRILRELAAERNLQFRRRFVGRRLTVVTLEDGAPALSENYLKVELATPRHANRIVNLEIGELTADGLRERNLLRVL
jgi:threonylcarbamoyladenosine tRNA methylthiotransferase MtaB